MDYEALRRDLMDYYGTAIHMNPMAMMDVSDVEAADDDELVELAEEAGFDLDDYED